MVSPSSATELSSICAYGHTLKKSKVPTGSYAPGLFLCFCLDFSILIESLKVTFFSVLYSI